MSETKKALWEKYRGIEEQMKLLTPDDERYDKLLERSEKVMNDIIKLESIESENKREKNRNIATYVTLGVSTVSGLFVVLSSFAFDKDYTLTSTAGRPSVTNFISKTLFRR